MRATRCVRARHREYRAAALDCNPLHDPPPTGPYMMIPYKKVEIFGQPVCTRQDRTMFNRHYSAVRITVERTFGQLKARFESLLKGMWFRDDDMYTLCFEACCILHNVCLEFKDAWDERKIKQTMKKLGVQKKAVRKACRTVYKLNKVGGTLEDGRARRKEVMEGATGSTLG